MSLIGKRGRCFSCGYDHGENGFGDARMLDAVKRIAELEAENEALRHDIERHIANHAADLNAAQGADARPVAITEAMAEEMGATGSPHSEPERFLFEAYCKGHCWAVGEWNGKHYVDMADSIRFAYWRDRAALATRDATPVVDARPVAIMEAVGAVLEGFTLLPAVRKILETAYYATRDAAPSDAQDAERAAKALERKRCEQYEWTDDEFEIWWNKDDRCKRDERIAEAQFILDAAIAPREKT
jgi:hypothetical protein